MFDATKGKKAQSDHVDKASDDFAARFDDLSFREQQKLLAGLNDDKIFNDLVNGSGVNSNGQQAAQQPALGAGNGQQVSAKEGLNAIMADASVNDGVKNALRRILTPNAADYIPVGNDGTPSELATTRQERDANKQRADDAERARDEANQKLTYEQDASKSHSLASKLKAANTQASPTNQVDKSMLKPLVKQLEDAVQAEKTSLTSTKVQGHDKVEEVVKEIKKLV